MRKPLFLNAAFFGVVVLSGLSVQAGAQSVCGSADVRQDDVKPPESVQSKSPQQAPAPQSKTTNAAERSHPLSVGGKFRYFAGQSFRPGSFVAAGIYSGLTMAVPPKSYPREWRQGAGAFGRNYGDFVASWAALQGGKFVAASALHEDPRYFPSHHKNWIARGAHAIGFAIVDQSDSGHRRLAVANISGALAGGFVGNAYLPDAYNNASHALSRSAIALGGFATTNLADEFHPELVKVAHKLHIPFLK